MNARTKINGGEAPIQFQAAVLKQQVENRIKRDADKARTRVLLEASIRLEDMSKDYLSLSSAAFVAKYRDRA